MEYSTVVALTLIFIGVAHSVLGELGLLKPLFAAEWKIETVPRFAVEIILRFAWHATTVAWVALAAILLGLDPWFVIAAKGVICAAVMFIALRGHLSWPLFALIAVAALLQKNVIPDELFFGGALVCAVVLFVLGALHVYWAFGGEKGAKDAVPTKEDGTPLFVPGRFLTFSVAAALFIASAIVTAQLFVPSQITWWLTLAITVAMAARAVGDFNYFGFMKEDHSSNFARLDDRLYTPVVVLIGFTSYGAVLV